MVKVAIAGGQSPTLGKSIVEAIKATGKHDVVIFSRASSSDDNEHNDSSTTTKMKYGARVIPVRYDDPTSLTAALNEGTIHTLISVIKTNDSKDAVAVHANMLAAAQATGAGVTQRLIMSDWSMGPQAWQSVDILAHKQELSNMCDPERRNNDDTSPPGSHSVECCTIQTGGFMEYFVQLSNDTANNDDDGKHNVRAGLEDGLMLEYIDLDNGKLVVPCLEDGTPSACTVTSIRDIGRYVAAALDLPAGKLVGNIGLSGQVLPSWAYVADVLQEKCSSGDDGQEKKRRTRKPLQVQKITPSECDRIAEEQGRKFQQALQEKGQFDLVAFKSRMVAQMIGFLCGGAAGGAVVEPTLNKLCPDVKPVQVEDLLVQVWGG